MDIERNFNFENDTTLVVQLFLDNDGVGPALISILALTVGGKGVRADSVAYQLAYMYPGHSFRQTSSHTIENSIASPGERATLFVLEFNPKRTPFAVVAKMLEAVEFNCCYCSVYGDCWRYVEDQWVVQDEDCVVPGAILRVPAR